MSNVTVLIADDEAPIRGLEKATLRRFEGIDIVEACDGAEALELIKGLSPKILVLDLMMPRVDGMGVLARLRTECAEASRPNVLVMTALVKPGLEEELKGLGVQHMLTKPFQVAEFAAKISEMVAEVA